MIPQQKTEKCKFCDGVGVFPKAEYTCPHCKGSGFLDQPENPQEKIEEVIKEFERMAFPIVHSNIFPEMDKEKLERLISFFRQKLADRDSYWLKKIEDLITEEILICHEENTPTSRLTSLAIKLKKDY